MVIGNAKTGGPKVYNVTKYLDDHPGGGEVMLDYAGKNADSMFEDIGHSPFARKTLKTLLLGTLKMTEEEKAKMAAAAEKAESSSSMPILPLLIIIIAIAAYFVVGTK